MRHIFGKDVPDSLTELFMQSKAAVLVIDVQNDFAHADGLFPRSGTSLDLINKRLPNMSRLISRARQLNVPIVHIQQVTLPSGASDSRAWLRLKTRTGRSSEYTLIGTWGAEPVKGFEPLPGELVVHKFRPDSFLHTELEMFLRAAGIETVIVCGMFTEGCVESTVRSASYLDFHVVLADDAVASAVPEFHEASLRLMRSRYFSASSDQIMEVIQSTQTLPPTNRRS